MERRIELPYRPTEKQGMFHRSAADEVLFGGAAGGGKSVALLMEAAVRCLLHPGSQMYLFRRSYRELMDTLIPETHRFLPGELGSFSPSSMNYTFSNGSVLRFRHCHREEDRFLYAGAEMHGLFMDELTHFTKEIYDFLLTRVRAKDSLSIHPVVRCASNPGGPGHGWVKEHFIDGGEPYAVREKRIQSRMLGEESRRTVQYIPALAKENPHLGKDYIFLLEDRPRAMRDALLYGNWNAFSGQVFTEWRDQPKGYASHRYTHVIDTFPLTRHMQLYRSFDFGYARPFCVLWFGVNADDVVYLYREWYGGREGNVGVKLTAREIAQGIREMESGFSETDVIGIADPSIWDGSRGESIAYQMENEGVYFTPGENARIPGKMQVHRRLAFDQEGRAGLYVMKHCRHTIRTLPNLSYDPHRPEDVDTRGEDHAYDALRYFLMARPVGQQLPPQKRRVWNPLDG